MTLRGTRFSLPEHHQLNSLTIDGEFNGDSELGLTMNHHIHLARGTQDFILDFREEILTTHTYFKYQVPENWDLNWNFKIGPAINPTQLDNTNAECIMWIKPEEFEREEDETNYINFIDSAGSFDFTQALSAKRPAIAAKGLNNYQAASFDGSDDIIYATNPATSDFDIPLGKDYLLCFVLNVSDTNSIDTVMQIGTRNSNGFLELNIMSTSTQRHVRIRTRVLNTNFTLQWNDTVTFDQDAILLVGEVNGTHIVRWNGIETTDTGTRQAIDGGTSNITLGAGYTSLADTAFLDGDIYEAIAIREKAVSSSGLTTTDCLKLEGYLAHKYKLTSNLPDDHAYKINPPRTSTV